MKVELKIMDLLVRNQDKKFTINEIAKAINEFYSLVHRTVIRLAEEEVLIKTRIGKAYVCELNQNNEKTALLIILCEIERKNEFYKKIKDIKIILEDFITQLKNKLISVILFGSYAKDNATKESDIDILLIGKNKLNIDKIVKEVYAKYGKEINAILMTAKDFKKQHNSLLIKEIINSHIILYGAEDFVKLILK